MPEASAWADSVALRNFPQKSISQLKTGAAKRFVLVSSERTPEKVAGGGTGFDIQGGVLVRLG